jgi:chromosomal replication initiation ATPase DnaA
MEKVKLHDPMPTDAIIFIFEFCQKNGIEFSELIKKDRRIKYVRPRQALQYQLYAKFNFSFPKIANLFNNQNHTTVIHNVKTVKNQIKLYEKYFVCKIKK